MCVILTIGFFEKTYSERRRERHRWRREKWDKQTEQQAGSGREKNNSSLETTKMVGQFTKRLQTVFVTQV